MGIVMRILIAIVALFPLWLGYMFVRGFIQGVLQARRPRLRVVRSDDEDDDLPGNL
jgi:hypothetical protein